MDQTLVEIFSLAGIYLCGGRSGRGALSGCLCAAVGAGDGFIKLCAQVVKRKPVSDVSDRSRLGLRPSHSLIEEDCRQKRAAVPLPN